EVAEFMTLPSDAPVLGFWLMAFGVQAADTQLIDLLAPNGKLLLHKAIPIDHNMAQYRFFVGIKRRGNFWPTGEYRATYQLIRQQQVDPVLTKQFSLRVF
ncbi:MAG: hypothetical protein LUQ06_04850, partial [Methylococcaceae bacterium]|nr:hypothetical protein [Methylococcaceae bacterium]